MVDDNGKTPGEPGTENAGTRTPSDPFGELFDGMDMQGVADRALGLNGRGMPGYDPRIDGVIKREGESLANAGKAADDANRILGDLMDSMNGQARDLNRQVYGTHGDSVPDAPLHALDVRGGEPSMAEQMMGGNSFTVRGDGQRDMVEEQARAAVMAGESPVDKDPGKGLTEEERARLLEEGMKGIDELIGLDSVKRQIKENKATVQALLDRQALGLLDPDDEEARNIGANTVFLGPPGTGKTTVARYWAKVLAGLGILEKGQLVETDRSGLVAGYQGQTAPKVNHVIDTAMGGVLFIDEVYNLNNSSNGGEDTFGLEAISTLLKRMEDDRGRFVVIIAGYTDETEKFLDSNPGLRSRFTDKIEFKDYTDDELVQIFTLKAENKGIRVTEENKVQLREAFGKLRPLPSFSNGRTARVLLDNVMKAQSMRYTELVAADPGMTVDEKKEILTSFTEDDIRKATARTIDVSSSLESKTSRLKRALATGDFEAVDRIASEDDPEESNGMDEPTGNGNTVTIPVDVTDEDLDEITVQDSSVDGRGEDASESSPVQEDCHSVIEDCSDHQD